MAMLEDLIYMDNNFSADEREYLSDLFHNITTLREEIINHKPNCEDLKKWDDCPINIFHKVTDKCVLTGMTEGIAFIEIIPNKKYIKLEYMV